MTGMSSLRQMPVAWWLRIAAVALVAAAATAGALVWASPEPASPTLADVLSGDGTQTAGPTPVAPPSGVVGQSLGDDTYKTLTGDDITFAEFEGRPLIVNFWASTCPPCKVEMPAIERVHQSFGDRLGIAGVDSGEVPSRGLDMVRSTGTTFPHISDPDQVLTAAMEITALPSTLFVGTDGRIVYVKLGTISETELRQKLSEHFGLRS